jgi:hypothetical protein
VISLLQKIPVIPTLFILGLFVGVLVTWILFRLLKHNPKSIKTSSRNFGNKRENFSTGTEVRFRNDVYHFAQKQHLAASFFSLNQITIIPKVLTPLIQAPKSIELAPTDSVSLTIPYVPDWPELAAIYKGSTMTLLDALQGESNIILAGHPGSGKSVALAWLSACIARNDRGLGKLAGLLPVYIHVTDIPHLLDRSEVDLHKSSEENFENNASLEQKRLNATTDANEVVEMLIQAISRYVSPLTMARLPRVVNAALDNQQAILILDRVDELPPHQASIITGYLRALLKKYPKLRIITAMSYDDLAELPTLGFNLLAMAAWTDEDRISFLHRWNQQWVKWISPTLKSQSNKINPIYLQSWLSIHNRLLNPLEYTLKVWAAFSGDILGDDGPSAIDAHIRRMTSSISDALPGLEQFALQLLIEMGINSNPSDAARIISKYKIDNLSSPSNDSTDQVEPLNSIPTKQVLVKDIRGIEELVSNGLLISYPGSKYGFSHPIFFGYLAGKALSEFDIIDQLQKQPSWSGKNLSMYYLARYGDVTNIIQTLLQEDDFLHSNHLVIARWLQTAPKNRPWRTIILRTLTSILQKERETISLAAKIVTAMAFSGDVGVSLYFRQLLKSGHPNLKQLGALGCGILADKKAIEDLNQLLQEQSPTSVRSASLALAAIGDKQSLEILASSLLNGSEELRRYAAEALANNPQEGQPALREGSSMDDLLVRRSVIFGLIRVNQPWAIKIVENLQLEDNEWVVRNAAIQAFDELQRKASYAPNPLPDLTETQWLIEYANKIGTTIAPGRPAEQLVGKALMNGDPDEKIYALDYFRMKCDPNTKDLIYSTYSNNTGELRDVAYYLLWIMSISGIKLPIPEE